MCSIHGAPWLVTVIVGEAVIVGEMGSEKTGVRVVVAVEEGIISNASTVLVGNTVAVDDTVAVGDIVGVDDGIRVDVTTSLVAVGCKAGSTTGTETGVSVNSVKPLPSPFWKTAKPAHTSNVTDIKTTAATFSATVTFDTIR